MDSKERLQLRTPLGDGMILQRDADIPICGWAGPGEKVTVRFFGATHRATAGPDGAWSAVLETHGAGGPSDMELWRAQKTGTSDSLRYLNIMILMPRAPIFKVESGNQPGTIPFHAFPLPVSFSQSSFMKRIPSRSVSFRRQSAAPVSKRG